MRGAQLRALLRPLFITWKVMFNACVRFEGRTMLPVGRVVPFSPGAQYLARGAPGSRHGTLIAY